MLQNLSGGSSRCARRALMFVLAWGLVMIGALQFRHSENGDLETQREPDSDLLVNSRLHQEDAMRAGAAGGSSRYLLQRSSIDSTTSYAAMVRAGAAGIQTDYESENSRYVDGTRINNAVGQERSPGAGGASEPLVDKREPRTEEELVREIESRLPSLPLAYWLKTSLQLENSIGKRTNNSRKDMSMKTSLNIEDKKEKINGKSRIKGCVPRFPSIFDLEFNNIYWQSLRTSNGTFQLFGAYYDERKLSRIGPAVRIVGMIDRIEPRVKTYCQMWFDGEKEPAIVETLEYKYVWYSKWGNYKQGIYQPYVIACKVPQSHWKICPPASVSIVEKPCDTASNNLRVIYNKPDVKKGFAVCVKGLDFLHDDLSVRLVEWIELIGLLGADKIFFYQLQVHPNVSKVLDHYTKLGKIDVTPLTLPGGQPNVPAFQHMYLTKKTNNKRQNELIPYNDCLYKHMYEYEYIALLDVDEVIMPMRDSTWSELMKRVLPKALAIRNETRASYNVRNVYFLDDLLHSHGSFDHLPRYMHMLQHVYRSKNFTKPNQYVKCFHNPERVVTLHNHFPLACLGAGCTSYPIETEDAQLQHYRADCVKSLKKTCLQYRENSVMDTTIWRYKDRLIERVTETLEKLGFFRTA